MKTLAYAIFCIFLLSVVACNECEVVKAIPADAPGPGETIEVTVCD
jgi:hypothetical protein